METAYILIGLFTIIGLMLLFQVMAYFQSRKQLGKRAPYTPLTNGIDDSKPAIVYFHSPSCGACKKMTGIISELGVKNRNVVSIDTSQSLDAARAFNVRGTPTVVQLKEGTVTQVLLGAQSKETLEELLLD